jgi:hypothetical protein
MHTRGESKRAAEVMRDRCAWEVACLAEMPLMSGQPITAAMVRNWIDSIHSLEIDESAAAASVTICQIETDDCPR